MKTALITGASGGIGLELARIMAKDGYNLVLIARRLSILEKLAHELTAEHGIKVHTHAVDLTDDQGVDDIVAYLERQNIEVDLLINNAGFGHFDKFTDAELSIHIRMIQLNITSLVKLTYRLLPGMMARKRGRIMNVASVAAFLPGPMMAIYYATKAFVLSFSEALNNEVRDNGISVTALCPGPTATGFQETAGLHRSKMMQMSGAGMIASAYNVAYHGYRAMLKGKALALPGFSNKLMVFMTRLLPRATLVALVRKIQDRK